MCASHWDFIIIPKGKVKAKMVRSVVYLLKITAAHHRHASTRLRLKRRRLSAQVGTRKMVNYARRGRSQRKLWWRTVAVLTCKLIVAASYRGERLIEPSSSWFPPKFPSG
jgi:hypothetical protein